MKVSPVDIRQIAFEFMADKPYSPYIGNLVKKNSKKLVEDMESALSIREKGLTISDDHGHLSNPENLLKIIQIAEEKKREEEGHGWWEYNQKGILQLQMLHDIKAGFDKKTVIKRYNRNPERKKAHEVFPEGTEFYRELLDETADLLERQKMYDRIGKRKRETLQTIYKADVLPFFSNEAPKFNLSFEWNEKTAANVAEMVIFVNGQRVLSVIENEENYYIVVDHRDSGYKDMAYTDVTSAFSWANRILEKYIREQKLEQKKDRAYMPEVIREGTEQEYARASRNAPHARKKYIGRAGSRIFIVEHKEGGTFVASKEETSHRGKVINTSYRVNANYLD